MKLNRKSILVVLIAFCTSTVFAQANLLNAKTPEDIGKKTEEQVLADNDIPLPYGYVDDRDVLWSTTIWEYIDLNEKINLPYYYPIFDDSTSPDRKSLFNALLAGIRSEEITGIYGDDYFATKLTKTEVEAKLFRVDTTDAGKDALNRGETDIDEYINKTELSSRHIEGYKIKGMYYIDKRQGELKYRLLAIAPVAPDVQVMNRAEINETEETLPLFWVWYPDARNSLHKIKVFNSKNSAYPISFDHLLNARRFSSIIYREENIYGNRDIADYIKGNSLFQVLESQRIKDKIRNKELDLWNY